MASAALAVWVISGCSTKAARDAGNFYNSKNRWNGSDYNYERVKSNSIKDDSASVTRLPIRTGWDNLPSMTTVTQVLNAVVAGDPRAAAELLPLVYDELRKLAAQRLAHEKPGQTLDATGLVHEAYLRLVGNDPSQPWNGRGHFFAAAAEAMRRILVEAARRKHSLKRGGGMGERVDELLVPAPEVPSNLLAVDEALELLSRTDPQAAELVKLRYFAGLTMKQAAQVLNISPRSADFLWAYAKAWLLEKLSDEPPHPSA